MLLKYTDLHNKIFRDSLHPKKVLKELLQNDYYIVGVNVHNDGLEIKDKKHFYRFFEEHFEQFEKKGLLMLPSVEIKIRDGNYGKLSFLINHFSKKFIPIYHEDEIHHVPLMIFVHGGKKYMNIYATKEDKVDILCHPEKDEGYFNKKIAKSAFKNDVGFEINYREYNHSPDKSRHMYVLKRNFAIMKETGNKMFICSAAIREEELVHSKELIHFGNILHNSLLKETIQNTHDLIQKKYGKLLEQTHYSLSHFKNKHKTQEP